MPFQNRTIEERHRAFGTCPCVVLFLGPWNPLSFPFRKVRAALKKRAWLMTFILESNKEISQLMMPSEKMYLTTNLLYGV